MKTGAVMNLFPALACFCLLVTSSIAAERVTFQGLTASSTLADVLRRFPRAVRHRDRGPTCVGTGPDATWKSADGLALCDFLVLEPYSVADTRFTVFFSFSAGKNPRSVGLDYDWGEYYDTDLAKVSADSFEERYETLSNLLISRYGAPSKRSQRHPLCIGFLQEQT